MSSAVSKCVSKGVVVCQWVLGSSRSYIKIKVCVKGTCQCLVRPCQRCECVKVSNSRLAMWACQWVSDWKGL